LEEGLKKKLSKKEVEAMQELVKEVLKKATFKIGI